MPNTCRYRGGLMKQWQKASGHGNWTRYRAKFEEQSKRQQDSRADPVWPKLEAYMGVGRKDDVIAVLQQEYAKHTNALINLKVDPFFDSLRGDPRFQHLLRNAHLSP